MEKIQISVNNDEGNEVVIRTGQAQELPVQQRETLRGVITTPADWLEQRTEAEDEYLKFSEMSTIVDKEDGTITLRTNDRNLRHGGFTIIGSLLMDPKLQELNINQEHKVAPKSLHQKLKFLRHLFADPEEHQSTLEKILKFKGAVTQVLEKEDNLKGSKLHHFEQKLESEFDCRFTLKAPVFKGFNSEQFEVEVCFQIDGMSVLFWLESIAMENLIQEKKSAIIDSVTERLRELGVTVIEA
ncbi:hypothetical protein [Lewinella sp. W8]|uniref:hypothetical protein n=1 Tax=Lewinella sp. W8 TaxID=2528208 RepID=UPI0010675D33|nr:hypothetical protein [Lewinella sp. W8]MTB53079.1 hypothetical protein [Lewinella sp. W8]